MFDTQHISLKLIKVSNADTSDIFHTTFTSERLYHLSELKPHKSWNNCLNIIKSDTYCHVFIDGECDDICIKERKLTLENHTK